MPHYYGPPPTWTPKVFDLELAARAAHCRIKRFRLTEREAEELRAYTGQNEWLVGYPVEIRADVSA
jgi:hypothetical protein